MSLILLVFLLLYVADLSVYSGALRCENELVARSKREQEN